ncbi:hypothetical protein FF38_09476, partial [Lucilia cuprina]
MPDGTFKRSPTSTATSVRSACATRSGSGPGRWPATSSSRKTTASPRAPSRLMRSTPTTPECSSSPEATSPRRRWVTSASSTRTRSTGSLPRAVPLCTPSLPMASRASDWPRPRTCCQTDSVLLSLPGADMVDSGGLGVATGVRSDLEQVDHEEKWIVGSLFDPSEHAAFASDHCLSPTPDHRPGVGRGGVEGEDHFAHVGGQSRVVVRFDAGAGHGGFPDGVGVDLEDADLAGL